MLTIRATLLKVSQILSCIPYNNLLRFIWLNFVAHTLKFTLKLTRSTFCSVRYFSFWVLNTYQVLSFEKYPLENLSLVFLVLIFVKILSHLPFTYCTLIWSVFASVCLFVCFHIGVPMCSSLLAWRPSY